MLFGAGLFKQVFAGGAVGLGELGPPVGQVLRGLAAGGAQQEEVKPGAVARLFDEGVGAGGGAFFKARLHEPDFAHVGGELAAAGDVADAAVKDLGAGRLQGGVGGL